MRKLLFIALILMISQNSYSQLKFVAHRGASYIAPENTIASIEMAWKLDSYGAECDIYLTKDKKIVIFHDSNTKRLTSENHVVSETNYSVLKNLSIKLKSTNSSYFKGQKIPLLEDALKTLPEDKLLVIEIKCGKEVLPELDKVIKKHWKTGNIAFISFGFKTISLTKALFPEVPCYFLSGSLDKVYNLYPEIVKNKLDGVDLNHKIIDKQIVEKMKKDGKDVWCYTVNTPEIAKKMKELGVSVITTDRPYFLKESMLNK
jgi:glycerophosphoryl diester phosphodiesterase